MNTITLPVSELKSALLGLGKVIQKKVVLPVLGAIRIHKDQDGWVTLTATDLDSFVSVRLEQPQDGETNTVLIPHQDLTKLVKTCPANSSIGVEEIEAGKLLLRYSIGNQTADCPVAAIPVVEFPELPEVEKQECPINSNVRESILEAMQCASTDATRYVLQSAFLDVSKPLGHYVVGTDGRHLFSSNSFQLSLKESLILPDHKFLGWKGFSDDGEWKLSVQSAGKNEGKKDTAQNGSWLKIQSRRWQFLHRQIEGNYPNWRQVVVSPDAAKTKITIPETDIESVEKIVSSIPCYEAVNNTVGIKVENGKCWVLGKNNAEDPWNQIEISPITIHGPSITVFINREYLLKALRFGLNEIGLIDPMSPLRFSRGGKQMIIMPLRESSPVHTSAPEPEPTKEPTVTPVETNERNPMPETSAPPAEKPTTQPAPAPAPTVAPNKLFTTLEKIEAVKNTLRDVLRDLAEITDTIKQVQREQKASEREVQSVRATLEKLQSVRI